MNSMVDVVLRYGIIQGGHGETPEPVQAMKLVIHGDCVERTAALVSFFRGRIQQDETVVRDNRTPVYSELLPSELEVGFQPTPVILVVH